MREADTRVRKVVVAYRSFSRCGLHGAHRSDVLIDAAEAGALDGVDEVGSDAAVAIQLYMKDILNAFPSSIEAGMMTAASRARSRVGV